MGTGTERARRGDRDLRRPHRSRHHSGLDLVTALTAVFACINNIGPGLNGVAPAANYSVLNDFEAWVCAFAMLIGRLQLMSVRVLFTPGFWRK